MRSIVVLLVAATAHAADPSAVLNDFGGAEITTPATPVSRPVSSQSSEVRAARTRAVGWLLGNQRSDGGWASGSWGGGEAASDVATTAFSVLALHRDGSGNAAAIRKGVEFVVRAVETAPEGPRLNTPEGTQIQTKLGPLVDTHFASLMLGELVPSLPADLQSRARRALQVCVSKVERAQNADGSFDANAWAPVLSTAVAAQGLSSAADLGIDVDDEVLARSDRYQTAQADAASGTVDTSAGAGVELYAVASALRGASNTAGRKGADAAPAPAQEKARKVETAATAMVGGDTDGSLIAGFGSVGGEEMLSYMMISDSLAEKGGTEWRTWEAKIGSFLASAQNADGSWVGHHCITSGAFATAGGIVTLSAGDHAVRATRG